MQQAQGLDRCALGPLHLYTVSFCYFVLSNFEEKEKRLKDILFIMEYWEELPERLQGKFEGMVTILTDFMQQKENKKNKI